jgi:hypothetical protein
VGERERERAYGWSRQRDGEREAKVQMVRGMPASKYPQILPRGDLKAGSVKKRYFGRVSWIRRTFHASGSRARALHYIFTVNYTKFVRSPWKSRASYVTIDGFAENWDKVQCTLALRSLTHQVFLCRNLPRIG